MRVILSIFLLISVSVSFGQDKLGKFFKYFEKNEYADAIAELEQVTASDPSNEEAWVFLITLYSDQNERSKAFSSFKTFYSQTSNKNEYLRAFWYSTAVSSISKSDADERIDFLNSIIEDPSIDGSLKAMAHETIANYYFSIHKIDDHWEELEKIGNLNKWQVVGSFENISASGFVKDFDPIKNPKKSTVFKNKHEADVKWFTSDVFRVGEWTRTVYHFDTDNSIVYAQTFVNSPSDQECQLRVGTSGSLKAWVNDQLVMSESEEYNNGIDTYRSKTKLKSGWNRVLIQVGTSEIESQNFMVRFTDDKGTPLSNITHENKYHDYSSVGGESIKTVRVKAETHFEEQAKNNPDKLVNHLLLSRIYLDNGKTHQSHAVLKDAEKLAPDNSYILWNLMQLYLREGNETELGIAAEKMKVVDAENVFSITLEFNEAINNENYDEAESILKRLNKVTGNNEQSILNEMELEGARGNNQKVIDLALDGFKKYPENSTFVQYKYTIESQVNQNPAAAQKVLKKYLKKNYSTTIQKMYANSFLALNKVGSFFTEYEKLVKIAPYSYGTYIDLADFYSQINQKEEALKYLDKAAGLAPYVGNSYYSKGELLLEMERSSEAKTNFEKALDFDPTDFQSRERIREINGESSPFDEFAEKDHYKLFKNAPGAGDYPEDNSVILLDETQVVIHEAGAIEEKEFLVVKVFDKAGVDFWKEYSVSRSRSQYVLIEKAEVWKKDGSKGVAEIQGGYVVFTNLEPGDGIFLSYKKQHYYQGSLAEHYWGKQYFDYFVPSKQIEFSFLYNENETPLQFKTSNGDIKKEEKDLGDMKLVKFSATDNESIKSEGYMPALVDIGRVLHYSTMPDWKFVSDWYADLSATKAKVDYEVKEKVKEVFPDGWEGVSTEEKIERIYEFIVNDIRYSSISFRQSGLIPQKASKVITTKIGDCKDVSTLFVSMCEEVGIDANLVLVNTKDKGQHAMDLPSINFNHCIAKVDVNGVERYVELTTDLYPFATVSSRLEGAFTLEIDPDKNTAEPVLIPRNKDKINSIHRDTDLKIDGNNLYINKTSYKTGAIGGRMRSIYRDVGEEERRKNMQEAISDEYANVKLDTLQFNESLENNSDSVYYHYTYKVTNPFTKIGSLSILKLPLADGIEPIEFLSVEDRKFAVELWKYFSYTYARETINLTIPAERKLEEVPETIKVSNKLLDYELSFKKVGNQLTVTRVIDFKVSRIELVDYEMFKAAMEKIVTADNLQIGFR